MPILTPCVFTRRHEERGLHNPAQLFARTALVSVGKPAVTALLGLLESDSEAWQVRAAAADALGDMGTEAAEAAGGKAIAALAAVVADPSEDDWVRDDTALPEPESFLARPHGFCTHKERDLSCFHFLVAVADSSLWSARVRWCGMQRRLSGTSARRQGRHWRR